MTKETIALATAVIRSVDPTPSDTRAREPLAVGISVRPTYPIITVTRLEVVAENEFSHQGLFSPNSKIRP